MEEEGAREGGRWGWGRVGEGGSCARAYARSVVVCLQVKACGVGMVRVRARCNSVRQAVMRRKRNKNKNAVFLFM